MSDTFYSIAKGAVFSEATNVVTVGAATAGSSVIELRITDGAISAEQAYAFCEKLADLLSTRNQAVVPTGTLL